MLLRDYARKRKFSQTPEPPAQPSSVEARRFCIQRHDARGLHYDLRLEHEGVLLSWAVPQGPTLDPEIKRLAVHVEDHPVAYADFEGVIPAGNYGAGSVMLWDTGVWTPLTDVPTAQQLERGDLKFAISAGKIRGEFALVRMKTRGKQEEWLLLKKKDRFAFPGYDPEDFAWSIVTGRSQVQIARGADAVLPALPAIDVMLAERAQAPPASGDWIYEVKWDGVRATATIDRGSLVLRSRRGDDITAQYPELSGLPCFIRTPRAVLDGEIAICDAHGKPRFGLIQPRIMARGSSVIAALAQSTPAAFFAFDLLFDNNRDLRNDPLEERRRRLEQVLLCTQEFRLSDSFRDGSSLLAAARQHGLEGILAKRRTSRYRSGRSNDWLKIKVANEDNFVICGYTLDRREYFGSLLLATATDDGRLVYAGNVGTGFDEKTLRDLHERMQPLLTDSPAFPLKLPKAIQWIRPVLKCRVKFSEITEQGRLRAPVYLGLSEVAPPAPLPSTAPPKLTHPNKVLFPADGFTKRDLAGYYDSVADLLVPHLRDRPLTLLRYPDGIESEGFFQKDVRGKLPSWFPTASIGEGDETKEFALCNSREALLYLVNLACIDFNPWMSRVQSQEQPDFMLVDLDPHESPYSRIVDAALAVRELIGAIGLRGYPKTTGGDGMHIYIPLEPIYSYDQVKAFAEALCRLLARENPKLFTLPRAVARRTKDRVYFDWMQIGRGKSISAPYVIRPKAGALVATPLDWAEVRRNLKPSQFHLRDAPTRFAEVGDLFNPVLNDLQRLEEPLAQLEKYVLQDVTSRSADSQET